MFKAYELAIANGNPNSDGMQQNGLQDTLKYLQSVSN